MRWFVLVVEVMLVLGGPVQVRVGAGSPSAVQRAWKVLSPLELMVMLTILGEAVEIATGKGKCVRLQRWV